MGARAAALGGGPIHDDRRGHGGRSRLRAAPIPVPAMQLKGEAEFMKNPSAFMESNQILVAFDQGVQETYALPAGEIEKIKVHQNALAEKELKKVKERQERDIQNGKVLGEDAYGLSIAMAKDMNTAESLKRKSDTFLTHLMNEAMTHAKSTLFTFATRNASSGMLPSFFGTTQYIVTPFLESLAMIIPKEVTTTATDGTPISLKAALMSLERKQMQDTLIKAAYIPYESNPNLVQPDTSVDFPIDGDIKLAFTAGMNGCSRAIKKKSPTELTVWHFPSPDSSPEQWKTFKEQNGIDATYDWNEYNGLSSDERGKLLKNHVTTTVMIRDAQGWKIQSQQNVGPAGGDQRAEMLKIGKIFGKRLALGQDVTVDIVGGKVDVHK
jgi:hypothetical protein